MKNAIITQGGYKIPSENLNKKQLDDLEAKLVAVPFTGDYGKDGNDYKVFQKDDKFVYVPRYFGIKEFGDTVFQQESIKASKFKFTGSLRDYQLPIVETCLTHLKENYGGILSVPCGRGKTTMALYLASQLKLKTLVLVHKSFLLDQWVERIKQFTDAKVGIIRQNITTVQNTDIVVGMIQSISMRDYPPEIFSEFGCVIVDETHHVVSKIFSKALFKLGTLYTIGLSATPQRADGLTYLLYWFLGEIMYKEQKRVNKMVAVKIFNYQSTNKLFAEKKMWIGGMMRPSLPKMIANLYQIEHRNELLVNIIEQIIVQNQNRKILILSARVSHLQMLKKEVDALIIKYNYQDEIKSCFYIGETKQNDRREAELYADILFATYDMAQEGLDIDRLNTLILATPKKNVEQAIGRIMRKVANESDVRPLIVDIKDNLSVFITHGNKRETLYGKNKYKIEHYYHKNNNMISEYDFNDFNKLSTSNSNKFIPVLNDIILDIDKNLDNDDWADSENDCSSQENNQVDNFVIADDESEDVMYFTPVIKKIQSQTHIFNKYKTDTKAIENKIINKISTKSTKITTVLPEQPTEVKKMIKPSTKITTVEQEQLTEVKKKIKPSTKITTVEQPAEVNIINHKKKEKKTNIMFQEIE